MSRLLRIDAPPTVRVTRPGARFASGLPSVDDVIEGILAVVLVLLPATFGGLQAWSRELFVALVSLMLALIAMRMLVDPSAGLVRSKTYLPIVCFVAVVLLQIVPLPEVFVRIVSPATARLERAATSRIAPDADSRLTLYRLATQRQLAVLVGVCGFFMVGLNLFRQRRRMMRVLAYVTAIGTVVSLLGIAQACFGSTNVYWFYPPTEANSAVFMCHSHFGQFANLAVGAALGLMMVRVQELRAAKQWMQAGAFAAYARRARRAIALLTIGCLICVASILVAKTRDGFIGIVVGGAAVLAVLLAKREITPKRGGVVVAAVLGIAVLLCIFFPGVRERLATLTDPAEQAKGRLVILRSLVAAWTQFPVFGTGLGSFEYVFPMFDRSVRLSEVLSHAENEYAQLLTETGFVGLGIMLWFVSLVGHRLYRTVRRPRDFPSWAAIGVGYGLIAVLIQSFGDFGQHLPANACLTALFCALIVSLSGDTQSRQQTSKSVGPRWRAFPAAMLLSIVMGGGWFVLQTDHDREAEEPFGISELSARALRSRGPADPRYEGVVAAASLAARLRPEDAELVYWQSVYRWQRLVALSKGADTDASLSAQLQILEILDGLDKAKHLCPSYALPFLEAGQIRMFALNDPAGEADLRHACELARLNPEALYGAGLCDARKGDLTGAMEKFKRAGSAAQRGNVLSTLLVECQRPDLAVEFVGDDVIALRQLMDRQPDDGGNPALRTAAQRRLRETLKRRCLSRLASGSDFASLADMVAAGGWEDEAAASAYREAILREPQRSDWRMKYARTLGKLGRAAEARSQAMRCTGSNDPSNPEATKFLQELERQSSLRR